MASRISGFMCSTTCPKGVDVPYACRMQELERLPDFERVQKVLPVEMRSLEDLAAYEERCVSEGFEGVMIRTPDSPYKCGRSTEREGWLLKIKRFEDAEAVVLDTYEGLSNLNPAEKRDAFGRTKRSSCMENKIGQRASWVASWCDTWKRVWSSALRL